MKIEPDKKLNVVLPHNVVMNNLPGQREEVLEQSYSHSTPVSKGNYFSSVLLSEINEKSKELYANAKQFLTFPAYLEEVEKNPVKLLRHIARYVLDCINYWDRVCGVKPTDRIKVWGKEVRPFAFITKPWEPQELQDKECVQGQLIFWNKLYEELEVAARKKHPSNVILVVGPNATGKSRVFETLFQALEEYSKTDEGALYTYEWAFYRKLFDGTGTGMGFGTNSKTGDLEVNDEDFVSSIPAGKNANPFFLLDKKHRVQFINELEKESKLPPDFNKDYLISNNMNDLSRKMHEGLWNIYKGDADKILKHVRVVRWTFSEQARKGLVFIPPQVTPNTRLEPITPEIDWDALPPQIMNAIRTSGVHVMNGDEANANHGIIVYDDMFKDAVQQHGGINEFLYLLRFAEKGKTTVSTTTTRGRGSTAVDEQFDTLIFGTTNDQTIIWLEDNYLEWDSLRPRINMMTLPFERKYRPITEVFRPSLNQLIPLTSNRHISPKVLDTFALWITMTYLFPSANDIYYNSLDINESLKPRLNALVKKLTVLEKALLYQGEDINSFSIEPYSPKYRQEDKDLLEKHVDDIANEYNLGVGKHRFSFYEGSIGYQTRLAEPILKNAVNLKPDECFSVVELFDVIEDEIKHGFDFETKRNDFITKVNTRISEQKKTRRADISHTTQLPLVVMPPPTKELLSQVKDHEKRRIQYDVYQAVGIVKTKEEQLQNLKKYVYHVSAKIAKRPLKAGWEDPNTGKNPNETFIIETEKIFGFNKDDKYGGIQEFRQKIVEAIGDWALKPENKGKDPVEYLDQVEFFKELIEKYITYDVSVSKEKLKFFLMDLRTFYERGGKVKSHNLTELEPERAKTLELGIKNLKEKGYCEKCIPKLVFFGFEWNH